MKIPPCFGGERSTGEINYCRKVAPSCNSPTSNEKNRERGAIDRGRYSKRGG